MKINFVKKLSLMLSPLLLGLILAFFMQSVTAVNPVNNDTWTNNPTLSSVLIGAGTEPTTGNLKVASNMIANTNVAANTVESYSGGDIYSNASIEAPSIGVFYAKDRKCNSCSSHLFGPYAGSYYHTVSCAAGDILTSCMGYIRDISKKMYGFTTYKSGDVWTCKVYANSNTIVVSAVCMSPDASTKVDNFN